MNSARRWKQCVLRCEGVKGWNSPLPQEPKSSWAHTWKLSRLVLRHSPFVPWIRQGCCKWEEESGSLTAPPCPPGELPLLRHCLLPLGCPTCSPSRAVSLGFSSLPSPASFSAPAFQGTRSSSSTQTPANILLLVIGIIFLWSLTPEKMS